MIRLVKILFEHLNIIYVFTVYYCTVNSIKEFMQFTSQILVERTRANERASVKEQGNNQIIDPKLPYGPGMQFTSEPQLT